MDNSDLLRAISSTTVQVFAIALIFFIVGLTAEDGSFFRPLALVAGIVMILIAANWIVQALTHAHAERRHEH